MKVYVVRHGETNMGKNKLIATEQEPLNENGMKQAIELGKELNKLNIEVVYCSPIERTIHTLKLFELDKNIPIIIDNRLKERDMGKYERVSFSDLDWEKFWGYDMTNEYTELEEDSTIRNFRIVQKEGNREVSRNVAHYNLQMIIAIGFKVDNERAVQFRKWANQK